MLLASLKFPSPALFYALILVLGSLGQPWPFVPVTVRLHLLLRGQEPAALPSVPSFRPDHSATFQRGSMGLRRMSPPRPHAHIISQVASSLQHLQCRLFANSRTPLYWVPNPSDTQGKEVAGLQK